MTGFLKPHGTSMALYGHFVSLSCENEDDVAALESAGLITHPDVDQKVFEDELDDDSDVIFCERVKLDSTGIIDLDHLDNPHRNFNPHTWDDWNGEWVPNAEFDGFGVVRDSKEVFALTYCQFEYQCDERDKEEDFRPLDRYAYEDPGTAVPTFSSNIEQPHLSIWEDESRERWNKYPWRSHNCGRKQAKWRSQDGRRLRKDRDCRHGMRQESAAVLHMYADRIDMWEEFAREWNPPTIPEFKVEMVGLTEADASYYEAEAQREREDYIRELEMSLWLDNVEYDESRHFDRVNNTGLLVDIWERHLFPERFEDDRPYRFSEWSYYDDGYEAFGYYDERDRYDDDRHLDGLDLGDLSDDGPTLEEWTELDRITIEQLLEEEDDRFSPSFVGSRRTMLRYHLSEPRRGKLKRKFSKSGSFLYRQTGAPRRAMYT